MAHPGFNDAESPLARLAMRKGRTGEPFVSAEEFAAGERLRSVFTRAGLTPAITQRWEATPRGNGGARGAGDLTEAALDARRRVEAAVEAAGPELAGVLLDVCCFLKGLETVERERQWPVRSAKLLLKAGLAALARHYGFTAAPTADRGARLRRWGAADYRPSVAGKVS
ncbi:DUF6456 domain-containing protein [Aurantimonas sp. CSK15Z-1]|nr:DUF6456 domain-containing protein [Aurantimonas sp. CSK15Z-1]